MERVRSETLFSRSVFTELCAAKLHCCEMFTGVEVKKSSQIRQTVAKQRNQVKKLQDLSELLYVNELCNL